MFLLKFYEQNKNYISNTINELIFCRNDETKSDTHIRDCLDLRRVMFIVELSLVPVVIMACYNTGYQAHINHTLEGVETWRSALFDLLGFSLGQTSFWSSFIYGLLFFVPVYLTSMLVGGAWELFFAIMRRKKISEGLFVTGLIFSLLMPASISLWQVALGISFAIVIGKEIYGGTGRNLFNPALVGMAFLYYAYPQAINTFDANNLNFTLEQAFWGTIPGQLGTTSFFACLVGAVVLLISGLASWKIMFSMLIGMFFSSSVFNMIGAGINPLFGLTPEWHLMTGGFAFACVFLATDPISATTTEMGKYYYGFFIGILGVIFRVMNPESTAFWMLAILVMNAMAPLIDHLVVKSNIYRRQKRELSNL
ncbi:MAG: RnfABCDGE type electron transport complex subunit D [Bacteriovoracaceae bacterium]|nr:RnfABCDGE type electron transport complex subunit D [Bacteriovoracaceae bacterium]